MILGNAIFDAIMAALLTEIDLHCCEKLDGVRPLLNQHWTSTSNWDKNV